MPVKDHEKWKAYQRVWAAAKRAKNPEPVSNRQPQISGSESCDRQTEGPRTKEEGEGQRALTDDLLSALLPIRPRVSADGPALGAHHTTAPSGHLAGVR
jgi:hypothetical protein